MQIIRSNLFNGSFYLWSAFMVVLFAPALLLPYRVTIWGQRQWARGVNFLMAITTGIHVEYRGLQNKPKGSAIIAAKHQSAWDTIVWHIIFMKMCKITIIISITLFNYMMCFFCYTTTYFTFIQYNFFIVW